MLSFSERLVLGEIHLQNHQYSVGYTDICSMWWKDNGIAGILGFYGEFIFPKRSLGKVGNTIHFLFSRDPVKIINIPWATAHFLIHLPEMGNTQN